MQRITFLKNSMNSKRDVFTYNTSKSQIIINPNWFLGFLEGEGTFGIKVGSALYLQVAQKKYKSRKFKCYHNLLNRII